MICLDYEFTNIAHGFDKINPCFGITSCWENAVLRINFYNHNVLLFLLED